MDGVAILLFGDYCQGLILLLHSLEAQNAGAAGSLELPAFLSDSFTYIYFCSISHS